MNKILGNKSQAWNNGLCKYIMDQDNKGGFNSLSKIEGLSKERFVMYRNIDDCEMKNQDILMKQQIYESSKKLSEAE